MSLGSEHSHASAAVDFLAKPCWEILHPHDAVCARHLSVAFADVFLRGVKIYGPLYLALALVKKRKLSWQALKPTLLAVVRTSTFVSLLGPGCLVINCLGYHLFKRHSRLLYFFAGAIPSFIAVLIERKERRREITIFMISVIIEALWRMGVARGLLKAIPFGEVLVFSIGMGILNYLYSCERDCIGNAETGMSLIVGDQAKPDWIESTLQKLSGISSKNSPAVHVVSGASKGFLIGFCIRAGQWLIGKIMRGGRTPPGKQPTGIKDLLVQSSKIGSFLALLVGGVRLLNLLFALAKINKKLGSFLAGAIAGASGFIYPSVEISLYLVAKGCEALVNVGNKYNLISWPLNSRHFEKVFFATEIGIGYYALCFENPVMRRSFWNFLLNISGGRLRTLPHISQMASKQLGYPLPK